jgi:hypothetical protein
MQRWRCPRWPSGWFRLAPPSPTITTLDEFNAIIRRDYETYGKVIKDVGVTVD